MKRIVAIIISVVMMLSMAGCGKEDKAKDAVISLLEALKDGDVEVAQGYLLKDTDGGGLEEDDMFTQVFTKLDYSHRKISGQIAKF